MTIPESNREQQHLEEIVAYLDGELSPDESDRVEQRLATDESYRLQLQGVERAWAVLDELPGVTVDDDFSKTTMEIVVGAAREEVEQRTMALPQQRRKGNLTRLAMVAAAILVGFLGFRFLRNDPNTLLLADLPVIQYIDIYSQFQSVGFLRRIDQALGRGGWATGMEPPQRESAEQAANVVQFQLVDSLDGRRQWLGGLTTGDKLILRTKYNRFRNLSDDQQERLRKLHQQLTAAPDAAHLQRTMLQYQQWLSELPPSRQFELREMPLDERVRTITMAIESSRNKTMPNLSDEQRRLLAKHIKQSGSELIARLSPEQQRRLKMLNERARGAALLRIAKEHPSVGNELRQLAVATLTKEQRKQFENLSWREQRIAIFRLIHEAWRHLYANGRHGEVGEQELEAFFAEELDATQRENLLTLPRDEMRKQLKLLYHGLDNRDFAGRPFDRPSPTDRAQGLNRRDSLRDGQFPGPPSRRRGQPPPDRRLPRELPSR